MRVGSYQKAVRLSTVQDTVLKISADDKMENLRDQECTPIQSTVQIILEPADVKPLDAWMTQGESDKRPYVVRCHIKAIQTWEYLACAQCKRKVAGAIDDVLRVTCGSCSHQGVPTKTYWSTFVLHDAGDQSTSSMKGRAFGEAHATLVEPATEGTDSEDRHLLCSINVSLDKNSDEECIVQQATIVNP